MPNLAQRYSGQTVLAVGAHPDDVEVGVGGTVARFAQAGTRVVMVVSCVPSAYETRIAESRRAAEILGCELRLLLDPGCSRVEDVKMYELVRRMDELVREYEPVAMFSHGPSDFHKDHLLVYEACQAAQRLRFLDFFCYYPASCRPTQVSFHPQVYVDVSETMDVKMEAINAHKSQFGMRNLETEFHRDLARYYGRLAGVGYAEGLEAVRMRLA